MGTKVVYNACFGGFSLSDKAIAYLRAEHSVTEDEYHVRRDMARHDPRLVDVVEKLGADANGMCANLVIAEIDGNLYRIDEYDGSECVVEPNEQEWTVVS